jgi:hypothetical protein
MCEVITIKDCRMLKTPCISFTKMYRPLQKTKFPFVVISDYFWKGTKHVILPICKTIGFDDRP